jgi:hypothetical protein
VLKRILFTSLPVLFSLTLFLSAGLLFLVEPMIGKMILPLLGGTPAVWNTCMMFFQAILLAGYGYAHLCSKNAVLNRQIIIHLALLAAAGVVLPIAISPDRAFSAEGHPIIYILVLLLFSVGLPFFTLSSNSLLLQKWFAGTGHPSAKDPYFLYSASNLGSMLALVAYPTLIEPNLKLAEQSRLWAIGYFLLLIFASFCATLARGYQTDSPGEETNNTAKDACLADDARLTFGERCRWILMAFVPSSLMLGITTFLSTDVAAIPLFWIIPLSLYLLSFIIVFARVPAMVHRLMILLLPLSITALIFVNFADLDIPKWVIFLFHLENFFIYCMVCHGEISLSRPSTQHLTEFYFWISVGGVLGGIFNALIAPLIFPIILEYPLVLGLGALILPVRNYKIPLNLMKWKTGLLYIAIPLGLVLFTYWSTNKLSVESIPLEGLAAFLHMEKRTLFHIIIFGFLILVCNGLTFLKKPFLFGIGIAAVMMTFVFIKGFPGNIVHRERSFFGVHTVERDAAGEFMSLFHGTTLHGKQWLNPDKRFQPLTYYHTTGPAGRAFSEFSGDQRKSRIAVLGLGTGSLAAYAGKGQQIDFYEIDAAVKRIATNPAYFTYVSDCLAQWQIIMGDGRLTMEKSPPNYYGIIILDAFSSDAIPVHLLTREAITLYFSKLNHDGVLLFHISNQYLDLAPVLTAFAQESGSASLICTDNAELENEKNISVWVLLARKEADFGGLSRSSFWKKMESQRKVKVWTDDFSNILSVFRW